MYSMLDKKVSSIEHIVCGAEEREKKIKNSGARGAWSIEPDKKRKTPGR